MRVYRATMQHAVCTHECECKQLERLMRLHKGMRTCRRCSLPMKREG